MAHKTELPGVDMYELGTDLANLRYDALASVLKDLADSLLCDAAKDEDAGRICLASKLWTASNRVGEAAISIREAWKICEGKED